MSKGYIEIQSTKGIKGTIHSRVDVNVKKIYWNIKFNIPLNPETVNEDNMDVTDVEGYTLTSDLSYSAEHKTITISPREPYTPNATYILNISTNVRSVGNNNLKEEVQIIFKLIDSEISSFKILKGTSRLDIDIKPSRFAPTAAQQKKDKLPIINMRINIWAGVGALIFFFAALMLKIGALLVAGTIVILLAIVHVIYQIANPVSASVRSYNKGAACYNDGEFGDAGTYFEIALMKNPNNTFAQRGAKRLSSGSAYVKRNA